MNIMRQGVSQKLKNNRCKHANTIFLCSPVLKIDYYIWKYLEATMALGFLKSFRALQQVAFLVHGTSFLRIIVVSVFFHGTALINVFLKDENIMCIELLRGVFSSLLQFPCNWANCRVVMVEYIRTKSGEFPISALYDILGIGFDSGFSYFIENVSFVLFDKERKALSGTCAGIKKYSTSLVFAVSEFIDFLAWNLHIVDFHSNNEQFVLLESILHKNQQKDA